MLPYINLHNMSDEKQLASDEKQLAEAPFVVVGIDYGTTYVSWPAWFRVDTRANSKSSQSLWGCMGKIWSP
jgi:hypothetical protein